MPRKLLVPRKPSGRNARAQYAVLRLIEERMETPMFVLSLLWAGLLVWELIWVDAGDATSRASGRVLAQFAIKLIIAPNRLKFLRKSWLSVFAWRFRRRESFAWQGGGGAALRSRCAD